MIGNDHNFKDRRKIFQRTEARDVLSAELTTYRCAWRCGWKWALREEDRRTREEGWETGTGEQKRLKTRALSTRTLSSCEWIALERQHSVLTNVLTLIDWHQGLSDGNEREVVSGEASREGMHGIEVHRQL